MKRFAKLLTTVIALAIACPVAASADVAGWGYNENWSLGAGYRNSVDLAPVATVGLTGEVKELAPADGASMALTTNGTVLAWGGDIYGQCGCGIRTSAIMKPTPVKFPPGTTIAQISDAGAHMMALTTAGLVYVWGGNLFGTNANGVTFHGKEAPGDFSAMPLLVKGLSGVKQVVAGGASDFAVLADGSVMAWGENKAGQLGDGTTTERTQPVLAKVSEVRQLAAGGIGGQGAHVLAILNSGAVVAWGTDGQGQLGDGTTKTSVLPVPVKLAGPVSSVTAAVSHSLAVMGDGTLRAWGSNIYGELGVTALEQCTKALFPCSTTPILVPGLNNVTDASAAFGFSLAVNGEHAYAWGWNQFGQLGNGTRIDNGTPTAVKGLAGVKSIRAGAHYALVLIAGQGPPQAITLTPGPGSLTAAWQSNDTTERWGVSWRPVTKPASKWAPFVSLPPAARSYTVAGLTAGVEYQVLVKNAAFGSRILTGAPR